MIIVIVVVIILYNGWWREGASDVAGPGTSVLLALLYTMSAPLTKSAHGQGVLEVDVAVHKVVIIAVNETAAS